MKRLLTIIAFTLLIAAIAYFLKGEDEPPKRVVFVTIDTLRVDHVGAYGYPRPTTPFIDSLSKGGVTFDRAISASSCTAPSHSSFFTSLYPFQHGVIKNHDTLSKKIYSIANFFSEKKFEVVGFPAVMFMEGKVGFRQYRAKYDIPAADISKKFWYRSASTQVDRVLNWLKNVRRSDQFFVWLHLYDVHQWAGQGQLPEPYFEEMEKRSEPDIAQYVTEKHSIPATFFESKEKLYRAMNGYDARLSFVDDQINRLSDELDQLGLGESVVWVITSDHGEGLGNHGYEGHGQYLYQEQLHIPLIMKFPDGKYAGRRVPELVRSIDVFPTLVELYGGSLKEKNPRVLGVSLFDMIENKANSKPPLVAFSQRIPKDMKTHRRAWRSGDLFAIQDQNSKYLDYSEFEDELYDLKNDPFELSNLNSSGQETVKQALSSSLESLLKDSPIAAPNQSNEELTSEALEELKALGYL